MLRAVRRRTEDGFRPGAADFVPSRVKYPATARENGIQGTVVFSFTDIIPARKVGAGCTESAPKAVQVINDEGARFKPGIQGSSPVRARYSLPVKFCLE
jgi:protein TonB